VKALEADIARCRRDSNIRIDRRAQGNALTLLCYRGNDISKKELFVKQAPLIISFVIRI
jgi:hypothetical protein